MAQKYEYYTSGEDQTSYIYGTHWIAQLITIGTVGANEPHYLTKFSVRSNKQGTPPTSCWCTVKATSGGKPTGADLVVSASLAAGDFPTNPSWGYVNFVFDGTYKLLPGTQYAFIFECSNQGNITNKYQWRRDQSGATYGGGTLVWTGNAGSSWTVDSEADQIFEEYGEPLVPAGSGGPAAMMLASGYI